MNVLLVDDHTLFRDGLALLLRPLALDLVVWEAASCEQAFNVLAERGPADLVLMDMALPGMPGLQGIQHIRQRWPACTVVALSSADDRDSVLSAVDAGAFGFIPKSASTAVLLAALRLILARGIYLPPSAFLGAGRLNEANWERQAAPDFPNGKVPSDLGLSPRQAEVLYFILQGKPAKLIERQLNLSPSTVKAHTSAVLRALNVTTRTQAVVRAGQLGLRFD